MHFAIRLYLWQRCEKYGITFKRRSNTNKRHGAESHCSSDSHPNFIVEKPLHFVPCKKIEGYLTAILSTQKVAQKGELIFDIFWMYWSNVAAPRWMCLVQ